MGEYEVIMDGGGPWGIRLQGGKDFGVQLNVARVTPGSKADAKSLKAGDQIISINGSETESLSHMEAQNLIKNAGSRLQLRLKKGVGISLGDAKQIGAGGFKSDPQHVLHTTDVTHSAAVDHKFNAKPKEFIKSVNQSSGGVTVESTKLHKFDPGEYARRKKEELESYRADSTKPVAVDSEVLKMLQGTKVSDSDKESGLHHGSSDLADLPPPPPELMAPSHFGDPEPRPQVQSSTFRMLEQHVDAGTADQVLTGLTDNRQRNPSQSNLGHQVPRNMSAAQAPVTVNPIPKAPYPSGPNFKVGRAAAPTFKPSADIYIQPKAPPPPAVNAGEIVNPNSKLYQSNAYPVAPAQESYGQPNLGRPEEPRYGAKLSDSSAPFLSPGAKSSSSSAPLSPGAKLSSSSAPLTPPAPPSSYGRDPPASPREPQITSNGRGPSSVSAEKKLVCHACDQLMMGPFVSAIGKTWHPEHFVCSSCQISLQNQAFVEENNKLFCERCYNQFYAPKCAHCNNAIIGNCVNALGKSWHPDHFVCSNCNRNFGSDGFLVDSGKPYCGKCFEDLFSVKCGKCLKPITGGEKYVEALNKNWHQECFKCNYCSVRLEGNSFFVNRGMPYCGQHKSAVV